MIPAGPFQLGILCDSNLWVAHYRMFFHKKLETVLEMCYMPREHAHTLLFLHKRKYIWQWCGTPVEQPILNNKN